MEIWTLFISKSPKFILFHVKILERYNNRKILDYCSEILVIIIPSLQKNGDLNGESGLVGHKLFPFTKLCEIKP